MKNGYKDLQIRTLYNPGQLSNSGSKMTNFDMNFLTFFHCKSEIFIFIKCFFRHIFQSSITPSCQKHPTVFKIDLKPTLVGPSKNLYDEATARHDWSFSI